MPTGLVNRKTVIVAAAGLLAIGGGVWGYSVHLRNKRAAVPADLTVDALKSEADFDKNRRKLREAMESKELTDAQKEQIRDNAHSVFEARMEQRMNEYFTASAAQKQTILDRQLDEMVARSQQWRAERAAGSQSSSGNTGNTAGTGSDSQSSDRGGGRNGQPSREQRKTRSESRSPEQSARRRAYFNAMQTRAQQRGLPMPFGGRGGR